MGCWLSRPSRPAQKTSARSRMSGRADEKSGNSMKSPESVGMLESLVDQNSPTANSTSLLDTGNPHLLARTPTELLTNEREAEPSSPKVHHPFADRGGTEAQEQGSSKDASEGSKPRSTGKTASRSGGKRDRRTKNDMLPPVGASSRTQNLIPALKLLLTRDFKKRGQNSLAILCHAATQHIRTELGDLGWGCGYRNVMMLVSALASEPSVAERFDNARDIRWIESIIEDAWADGYDSVGAEQLHHRLKGTRKWIGTTEVYVFFTYLGIRCTIFDFPKSEKGGDMQTALIQWVKQYFADDEDLEARIRQQSAETSSSEGSSTETSPVIITSKWPIYLQHSGHSRTIIGIELSPDGEPTLLVFDPGRSIPRRTAEFARALETTPMTESSSPEDTSASDSNGSPSTTSSEQARKRSKTEDVSNEEGASSTSTSTGRTRSSVGHMQRFSQYLNKVFPADPRLLSVFRVNLTALSRNNEYQILRIESDLQLTQEEQSARKNVRSLVIK